MGLSVEANPDIHELILDFISRQERLENLDCTSTMFRTAEQTTKMIETVMQSEVFKTIQYISFQEADFTSDDTCELLAQFLATAPKLKHTCTGWQLFARGIVGRLVRVEWDYCSAKLDEEPTSENMGSIRVVTSPK